MPHFASSTSYYSLCSFLVCLLSRSLSLSLLLRYSSTAISFLHLSSLHSTFHSGLNCLPVLPNANSTKLACPRVTPHLTLHLLTLPPSPPSSWSITFALSLSCLLFFCFCSPDCTFLSMHYYILCYSIYFYSTTL